MLSHVLLAGHDLDGRTGLEIGALHNPLTARSLTATAPGCLESLRRRLPRRRS